MFNILHTINYIYLRSLSVQQHRFLSIALNIMDRDVRNDSCLYPILCHVWVEIYVYQRKGLWRGDSNPWTWRLLTLYIVFNILHTINYIYLRSLSMPQLRSLSIAFKTIQRDLSNDLCLNPCVCHVWLENYAYQGKSLGKGIVTLGQGAYWPCT